MGIELLIAIGLALSAYSAVQPAPGTYQIIQDGASIIRVDTRTGVMERCAVGEVLVCKVIQNPERSH